MAESTSSLLQILLMETGGRNNDWGDQTNANLSKIEDSIAGQESIASTGGTTTLTDDEARPAILNFSGTLTSNHIVVVPNRTKVWLVYNAHTLGAYALTMKTSGGAPITIPAGGPYLVYCAGSDVVRRAGAVSNSDLATMANGTVKANISGGTATPSDVTLANLAAAINAAAAVVELPGVIKEWGGAIAGIPTGYLFCNGAAVSRTTYAALYTAIGTKHGAGDGSTTFNLPDRRNKFPIGAHSDSSSIANTTVTGASTKTGGSKDAIAVSHTHTGTTSDNGNHTHAFNYEGQSSIAAGGSQTVGEYPAAASGTTGTGGIHAHTFTTASAGSSGTNANLPPYEAAVYMIKT